MPPIRIRYSERMEKAVDSFAVSSDFLSKAKSVEYIMLRYLNSPVVYSELEIFELREPSLRSLSIELSKEISDLITGFANSHGITVSSAIRMAIYQELICHEESDIDPE